MNLRALYRNLLSLADSITQIVGTTDPDFPLTNIENSLKTSTWRTADPSSNSVKVVWLTGQTISGVALAFTNLILNSTLRIKLYDAEVSGALLYDSDNVVISGEIEIPIGFVTSNSLTYSFGGGVHAGIFFDKIVGVKMMELSIASADNPDGFIEVGTLLVGDTFEPDDNAEYGARIDFEDTTTSLRSAAGNLHISRGTITRSLDFSMGDMSPDDSFNLTRILRAIGKSQPIFLSLIPRTPIDQECLNHQVYGVLDGDTNMVLEAYNIYSSRIRIIEL